MKSGHQIACRGTKHLKNLNDIDMTSNDLEMTFNYVIFNISDFWSKLLPPNITKMEITPPYYHRYHTLVYIFKKICSEKATFEIFNEV